MPTEEEIKATIASLRESGMSDQEILETLKDMGVPEDIIRSLLGKREEPVEVLTKEVEKRIMPKVEEKAGKAEVLASAMDLLVTEHGQKIEELHEKVDELHKKVEEHPKVVHERTSALEERLDRIEEEIEGLRREISDVRALLKALQRITQEILETNRKVMVGLYEEVRKAH